MYQKKINNLSEQLILDQENLKRKYQPKISSAKELIQNNKFFIEQSTLKLDQAKVEMEEFTKKAIEKRNLALIKIDNEIQLLNLEVIKGNEEVKEIEINGKK